MRTLLSILLVLIPFSVQAETFQARTPDELRAAFLNSVGQDVTVVVEGTLRMGRGLRIVPGTGAVTLVGAPGAVIDFDMIWDGDWKTGQPANGIEFNCSQLWVRGIEFRNYHWSGSALKTHVTETAVISDCRFIDIGTIAYPTKTGKPAADATEVWYANVIGGAANAHLIVDDCLFLRCATGDTYGHCIYAVNSCKSLTVLNCTFDRVGHVHRSQPGHMRLFGNAYTNLLPTPSAKNNGIEWAYWVYPSPEKTLVAMFETHINAAYRWPIREAADPGRHLVDRNDYQGLRVVSDGGGIGRWMVSSTTKPADTFVDWQKLGFDCNSEAPDGN